MTDSVLALKLRAPLLLDFCRYRLPRGTATEKLAPISMWIILSLSASVLWGLTYVIDEQIYKQISVFSSLSIASFFAFLITLAMSYFLGDLRGDVGVLISSKKVLLLVGVGTLTFIAAELLIGVSIQIKNAALASLIEVSYPLFIVFFTAVLIGETEINQMTILGGLLILSGAFLLSYFNR